MTDLAARVEELRRRAPKATVRHIAEPPAFKFDEAAVGIARAAIAAGNDWGDVALEVVRRWLEANEYLHVDQIRPHLPELPEDANLQAFGGVITRAKAAGWISHVQMTLPGWDGPPVLAGVESNASRGGLKALWRSNIYQGTRST